MNSGKGHPRSPPPPTVWSRVDITGEDGTVLYLYDKCQKTPQWCGNDSTASQDVQYGYRGLGAGGGLYQYTERVKWVGLVGKEA